MNGYVIVDDNKMVWVRQEKNGSYSLTTDKNRALIFDSKIAADKVFKSNLSKLIKSKGVAVKSVDLQVIGANNAQKQVPVGANNEIQHEISHFKDAPFGSSEYIIYVLSDAVSKLNKRYDALVDEMSKYDRQKTDVEHYIEFNIGKLNACDGYKAYKLLQNVLIERRKIKDELAILQTVRDRIAFPEEIANIDERVQELKERRYEPREFTHLFNEKERK